MLNPAVVATLTAILFSAVASAPTPVYRLYQETLGLTPFLITLIFAIYSFTMIAAFLTVARLSDFVGRKPMALVAVAINATALLLFLNADSSAMLLAARATQGVGTGIALVTLGAMITDAAPALAAVLNSSTAFVGLTLGTLSSGALVAFCPWPTRLIYGVMLALMLVAALGLMAAPETRARMPGAASVLRPQIKVSNSAVGPMLQLLPLTLATWALGGFYFSLMPSLMVAATGVHSPFVGAAVVSALMVSGGISSYALRGLAPATAIAISSTLLAFGVAATTAAIAAGSPVGMFLGTILAGIGFGSSYGASLRVLLPLAAAHERAGLLSAYFVESYLAFSLPAIGAGLAAPHFGLAPTALVYGTLVAGLAFATAFLQRAAGRS